jgi:DNA-directed RNA polymerase specialized sigma24 family protein
MPAEPNDDLDWAELLPQINRIARTVGRRKNASPRVRDELSGVAVEHVYAKSGQFDPNLGSFQNWCSTVLANKCVSLIRKEASDARLIAKENLLFQKKVSDAIRVAEEEDPLPQIDWPVVFERARLNPTDRLLVALDLVICDRFQKQEIARWLSDASLPADFPVQNLADTSQGARRKALAHALLAAEHAEATEAAIQHKSHWIRTRLTRAKLRIKPFLTQLLD